MTLPVTLIIPHWNRLDELRACIRSLDRLTSKPEHVWIVDDASSDQKAIQAEFSNVLALDSHVGPGQAKNLGLEKVKTPYVWFLDSDTEVFQPDCLKFGIDYLNNHRDVGVIGGEVVLNVSREQLFRVASLRLDYITRDHYIPFRGDLAFDATNVASNNFLTRTDLLRSIRGFHPDLITGEDKLATLLIRKRNLKTILSSDFAVIHKKSTHGRRDLRSQTINNVSNSCFIYGLMNRSTYRYYDSFLRAMFGELFRPRPNVPTGYESVGPFVPLKKFYYWLLADKQKFLRAGEKYRESSYV